jgi:hypothetical protein
MDNQQPSIKLNAKKYFLEKGTQYGPYIVTETDVEVIRKSGKLERLTRTTLVVTGDEILQRAAYIVKFQKIYDEKLKTDTHQFGLRNYLYRISKRGATDRGHNYDLTFEEHQKLIYKDCAYCGAPPKKSSNNLIIKRGKIHDPYLYFNGVDRIDNEKGYNTDNCVPCCTTCNYMKRMLSVEEFLAHISRIYKFNEGSTTIPKGSTL